MHVLITVDTEEDNQWQTNLSTTKNLACLPRFQRLCESFDLKPTYLCTYGVVTTAFFSRELAHWQVLGKAEIGAHLHPWATPPFDRDFDGISKGKPYPSEIPLTIFEKKLKSLTDCITDRIGQNPRSYRAGRWGFIAEQIQILEQLGYTVDSSVTPFKSWKGNKGLYDVGPDYTCAPFKPYWLDYRNVCRSGNSKILEIPVTVLPSRHFMQNNISIRRWYLSRKGFVRRIGALFGLEPCWLRPLPEISSRKLIHILELAEKARLTCVNVMFHSSELLPGGSPYNPDERSIEKLYMKFERLFRYISQKKGWKGVGLSEISS